MSEVPPSFPLTSMTLKRASKWQLMTQRHVHITSYDDRTNVIRRVTVSSTNTQCRRSSQ
ncbi:hypothetical protein DPMN_032018 [Dreissena polymorpha]|uniref:Uncharacterized protein n=1 Tax=Dreissena polymorpha TaxID=45954 RepID=A0A9D4M363_DREPO|nr:hypothetical protein DPMN_032018 [Dreissena polymorpha]